MNLKDEISLFGPTYPLKKVFRSAAGVIRNALKPHEVQPLFVAMSPEEEKFHAIVKNIAAGRDIEQTDADFVRRSNSRRGDSIIADAIKTDNVGNLNKLIGDDADRTISFDSENGYSTYYKPLLVYAIESGAEAVALALVQNPFTDVTKPGEHRHWGVYSVFGGVSSSEEKGPTPKDLAYQRGMQRVVEAINHRINDGPPPQSHYAPRALANS